MHAIRAVLLTVLCGFSLSANAALYSIATSTNPTNGRVIIYRYVEQYDAGFVKAEYPVRITLRWKYAGSNGMPDKALNAAMTELEDTLTPVMEDDAFATLAIVRTGNDLREWVYYAKSKSKFGQRLNRALAGKPVFPIDIFSEADAAWAAYSAFTAGIKPRPNTP